MSRRRLLISAVVLLALALLIALLPGCGPRRALERYKASLRASGHLKSLAEARPQPLASAVNGGPDLTSLMQYSSSVPAALQAGFGKGLTAGTRRVNWFQSTLPSEERTNVWPELRLLLGTNAANLAELRSLLDAPVLEFPVRYEDGERALLPHAAKAIGAAQLLSADAVLQLHDDRPELALADTIAGVHLAARWNREPILIPQFVRIAIAGIMVNTTWEVLQFPGWSDPGLAALQAAWLEVDLPALADATFAFEAACMVDMLEHISRKSLEEWQDAMTNSGYGGRKTLGEILDLCLLDPKQGEEKLLNRYPGWWVFLAWQRYQVEHLMLQQVEAVRESLGTARERGVWQMPLSEAATNVARLERLMPKGPIFVPTCGQAYLKALGRYAGLEAQRSLVITAIALERHRLQHGSYPATLERLVPEFLAALPRDPMDGQPVRYRRNDDGTFTLYTVGTNGADDGGDPTPTDLSSVWLLGKDIVWPKPAAQTEVDAYHDSLVKQLLKKQPNFSDTSLVSRFQERDGLTPTSTAGTNPPPAPNGR